MRVQRFVELEMEKLKREIKSHLEVHEHLKKEMLMSITDESGVDIGLQKAVMTFDADLIDSTEEKLNWLSTITVHPYDEFPDIQVKSFKFQDYEKPIRMKLNVSSLCGCEVVGSIINDKKISVASMGVFSPKFQYGKKDETFKKLLNHYLRMWVGDLTFYGSPDEAVKVISQLYPRTACESFGHYFVFRKSNMCRFALVSGNEVVFYD